MKSLLSAAVAVALSVSAAAHAGSLVDARKRAGTSKYKVIEPAPGRYVKAKAT